MTTCSFRPLMISSLALAIGCISCGSDQRHTNSPEEAPASESPPTTDAGNPATPTGEPTGVQGSSPSSANEQRPDNVVGMSPGAASGTAPAQLSQAQVALITELANTSEIEQGKLAEGKAKSPRVKKFASMMVKHHGQSKADQTKLFKELNLTPAASPDSSTLKTGADQTLGTLRGADGAAFDIAYMNAQVDEHEKVLDTIDRRLMPAATDQKLIDGLKEMRETVASHLKEAKAIQAELNKTAAR